MHYTVTVYYLFSLIRQKTGKKNCLRNTATSQNPFFFQRSQFNHIVSRMRYIALYIQLQVYKKKIWDVFFIIYLVSVRLFCLFFREDLLVQDIWFSVEKIKFRFYLGVFFRKWRWLYNTKSLYCTNYHKAYMYNDYWCVKMY